VPMIREPYWTGAVTPSGACAFVSRPHPHFRVSTWCSVVTAFTGGMSMTCLRSTAVTGAFFRDFPQQPHLAGRYRTFLSGSPTAPSWPRAGLSVGLACGRTCRAATSGPASPARPTTAACWNCGSSPSPGRRDPRPATAAPSPARAAPRAPRPAPPAVPAAARSQPEAPRHRCRERRASRARTNAATAPPGLQIGAHRRGTQPTRKVHAVPVFRCPRRSL